jgi:hypothetical protein
MKVVLAIIGSVAILRLFCGEYEIDPFYGVFRFSSVEETIEQGIVSEFKKGEFKKLDPRVETIFGNRVDPQPVKFHSKNRLKNGDLLIVKRKLFGNNLRDGHRFIFYFYGAGDLGSCTAIMNGELGLDNKYHIHQFKRNSEYSWMEVRSRFVLLD